MDIINDDKQASSGGSDTKATYKQPSVKSDVAAGDLITYEDVDPALAAKMHLLNQVFYTNRQESASVTDTSRQSMRLAGQLTT